MRLRILYIVAALFAAAVIGGSIALSAGKGGEPDASASTPTAVEVEEVEVEPPSPTPSPTPVVPLPTDFTLTVTVLEKQCFGSAGCNLTVRLGTPTYIGPVLSEDQEFTVVYNLLGGEQGPQTNSFTLRGSTMNYDAEEFIQTTSSRSVVTAKVTQVLPN